MDVRLKTFKSTWGLAEVAENLYILRLRVV